MHADVSLRIMCRETCIKKYEKAKWNCRRKSSIKRLEIKSCLFHRDLTTKLDFQLSLSRVKGGLNKVFMSLALNP